MSYKPVSHYFPVMKFAMWGGGVPYSSKSIVIQKLYRYKYAKKIGCVKIRGPCINNDMIISIYLG